MTRFIEFVFNHWELVLLLLSLVIALIYVEISRSGQNIPNSRVIQLMNHEQALLVDIREQKQFRQGHITGALNIPYAQFKDRISELGTDYDRPIILVCKMGQHSGAIGKMIKKAGFQRVNRLAGGMAGWQGEHLPLVKG